MTTMTKKEMIAALKERLASDDRWALRALTLVYRNQTDDEQHAQATLEHNGIGFSGPDAEILSSFAQQCQRRGTLSPRQMHVLKRKMPSYAGQVMRMADTPVLRRFFCVNALRRLRIQPPLNLKPPPPESHEAPHPLPQRDARLPRPGPPRPAPRRPHPPHQTPILTHHAHER